DEDAVRGKIARCVAAPIGVDIVPVVDRQGVKFLGQSKTFAGYLHFLSGMRFRPRIDRAARRARRRRTAVKLLFKKRFSAGEIAAGRPAPGLPASLACEGMTIGRKERHM